MWTLELLVLNVTQIPMNGDVATGTDFFMEIYADYEQRRTFRYDNLEGDHVTLNAEFVFHGVTPSLKFEIWDDDYLIDDRLCQGFWRAIDHPHIVEALKDDHQPSRHVFKGLTGVLTCEESPDVPLVSFDLNIWKDEPDFYQRYGDDWRGLCSTETEQSPIFFPAGEPELVLPHEEQPYIACNYHPRMVNEDGTLTAVARLSGHGVEITPYYGGDFGYCMFGNERYTVKQFHFHTPAEHCFGDDINGTHEEGNCESRRDIEMHIVHQTWERDPEEKKYAVIGLTFNEKEIEEGSKENFLWDNLRPILNLTNMLPKIEFKTARFLLRRTLFALEEVIDTEYPDKDKWFSYKGSFTTPPCTEGVRWYNLRYPGAVPTEFVEFMEEHFHGSYRNLQKNENQHSIGRFRQYLNSLGESP